MTNTESPARPQAGAEGTAPPQAGTERTASPQAGADVAPSHFHLRVSANFFAGALTHGVTLSFFPQWLASLGYPAATVGLILSAQLALRTMVVPFLSMRADKAKERRTIALFHAVAALVLSLGFWLPQSVVLSMAVALVIVPFWGALYPVVDSIALSGQRRFGMDYARMRLWGSMSFLLASLLTGMATGAFGIGIVPYLMSAMFALAFASAWLLPRLGPVRAPHLRAMLPLDGTASGLRPILPLFIGSALIIGSHGFFYAFGSIHYASIGHSQTQIGLLWAFGVICEVALFWYARAFMHRAKPETFIIIGGLGAVVRWMLLPVSAASPAPLLTDFMLQSLHALSFALVYIATQKAVSERFADAGTGAVLGLNIFCNGVVFAVTTFVGGYLYEHFAIWGVYAMAACALTGIGVVAIVAKRQL